MSAASNFQNKLLLFVFNLTRAGDSTWWSKAADQDFSARDVLARFVTWKAGCQ